jgi:RecA/RadA recombinase
MAKKLKEENKNDLFDAIRAKMKKSKAVKMSNKSESLIPWKIPFRHKGLQKATGGLLGGKIMMIEAFSQTGKSFLGYELMAGALKMGGQAYLQDREQAYEPDYGAKAGLGDEDAFFYDDKIVIESSFAEWVEWIKASREVIKDLSIPLVIVDDSFAVSRSEEQTENDEKGKDTGYGAMKKNNAYYDKLQVIQPILQEYACSLVIINQLTEDKSGGMFVDPTKRKGPQLEYFCSQILRGKKGKKLTVTRKLGSSERKVQVGMTSSWETVKNRFVEPFKKVDVRIFFRKGLAPWSGLLELLVLEGDVTQKSKKDPNDARRTIKGVEYKDDFFPEDELKQMCAKYPELLEPRYTAKLDDVNESEVEVEDDEDLND